MASDVTATATATKLKLDPPEALHEFVLMLSSSEDLPLADAIVPAAGHRSYLPPSVLFPVRRYTTSCSLPHST